MHYEYLHYLVVFFQIEFENKLSQLQQAFDSKSALCEKLALQIAELKGKYGQLEIEYEHRQV